MNSTYLYHFLSSYNCRSVHDLSCVLVPIQNFTPFVILFPISSASLFFSMAHAYKLGLGSPAKNQEPSLHIHMKFSPYFPALLHGKTSQNSSLHLLSPLPYQPHNLFSLIKCGHWPLNLSISSLWPITVVSSWCSYCKVLQ